MFSFGQTGFRTGGFCRIIHHLGMTESRNHILFHKHFIADRAMLPFGETCFGTGGFCRFIHHLGMTESGNHILFHKHFVTYRAMLPFGETCCGAGGFYGFIDHFGMAESILFTVPVTIRTTAAGMGGISAFGTGRSRYGSDVIVSQSRYDIVDIVFVIFTTAIVFGIAHLRAGRGHNSGIVFVAHGNIKGCGRAAISHGKRLCSHGKGIVAADHIFGNRDGFRGELFRGVIHRDRTIGKVKGIAFFIGGFCGNRRDFNGRRRFSLYIHKEGLGFSAVSHGNRLNTDFRRIITADHAHCQRDGFRIVIFGFINNL